MSIKEIIRLGQKYLYISVRRSENGKNARIALGPSGSLLMENLRNEWIFSNVTDADVNVSLYSKRESSGAEDSAVSFSENESLNSSMLPFGIADISAGPKERRRSPRDEVDFKYLMDFGDSHGTKLSTKIFLNPDDKLKYFFHRQRQRKLWWKKISAVPTRFKLGEIRSSETISTVDIVANYSWGDECVETISAETIENGEKSFQIRENIFPAIVKSEMYLEKAVYSLLCDSVDEDSIHKSPVIRLHRKIAPYKCSFMFFTEVKDNIDEMQQLAFYLTKLFRKANISTVLLRASENCKPSQIRTYDEWGIPYTIIIDDESLSSGILKLRSRDTTLNESVHISDIVEYLTKILKNF